VRQSIPVFVGNSNDNTTDPIVLDDDDDLPLVPSPNYADDHCPLVPAHPNLFITNDTGFVTETVDGVAIAFSAAPEAGT
jgi:hypothetical protein